MREAGRIRKTWIEAGGRRQRLIDEKISAARGGEHARLGEEPLEPGLVVARTIEQIGEAGPLPRIQCERSAICQDLLGFGHGGVSVVFAVVATCRTIRPASEATRNPSAWSLACAHYAHAQLLPLLTEQELGSS